MRRKHWIAAVLAVVMLGAGGYGVFVYPSQAFRKALDAWIASLPPEVSVTYRDARYSLFSDTARIEGLTAASANGSIKTEIAAIEASGTKGAASEIAIDRVAVDQLLVAWSAEMPQTDGKLAPVATQTRFDRLTMRGVMLDEALLQAPPPALQPQTRALPGIDPADLERARLIAQRVARILAALQIGPIEYGSVTTATEGPGGGKAQYGKSLTESFARGRFGSQTTEGMRAETGFGSFQLEKIASEEIDLAPLVQRLANGAPIDWQLIDGVTIAPITLSGLSVRPSSGGAISIGRIGYGPFALSEGRHVTAGLRIDDLTMKAADLPSEEMRTSLAALGYDALGLSFAIAGKGDIENRSVSIDAIALDMKDGGRFEAMAAFEIPGPEATGMRLAATLKYVDHSLAGRLLKAAAEAQRVAPDQLRSNLIASVANSPLSQMPNLRPIADALTRFITEPGTLTITLPEQRLAIPGQGAMPDAAALKVSATATQP